MLLETLQGSASRRISTNSAPGPSRSPTEISPPCASIIRLAIEKNDRKRRPVGPPHHVVQRHGGLDAIAVQLENITQVSLRVRVIFDHENLDITVGDHNHLSDHLSSEGWIKRSRLHYCPRDRPRQQPR